MEVYPAYILDKKKGFFLDPRTKLLFMVVIVTLLFVAHDSLPLICALTVIPLALLMINSQWKTAAIYGVLFILAIIATYFRDIVELPPVLNGIIALLIELVVRFFPAFMMGYYIIKSTKADEFVTAMERWHITKKVLIPIAVVFRFVPTMQEEAHSITEAMRMREIRFGTQKFWRSPGSLLEYRLIPLLISVVKIGDELSAAALTRGLGRQGMRSSIARVGFTWRDFSILVVSILLILCAVIRG